MFDAQEAAGYVDKFLEVFGLAHRDLDSIIVVIMLFGIVFVSRYVYRTKILCNGLSCSKAEKALDAVHRTENKIVVLEKIVLELKAKSDNNNDNLDSGLRHLESQISQMKSDTAQLNGIIMGSTGFNQSNSRRRIRHEE